jgi:CDP-diacylglycerol--glycerol-3-phosphate 3-phosphatidyltransferase
LVLFGLEVMAAGEFWRGFCLLAAGRIADILDGTAADRTGTKGPVGEGVDATMDKLAAIAVLAFFVRDHWMPLLPVICVALQVSVNSLLAFTARVRHIELHPSAAGKVSTVLAWVVLLAFPVATEIGRVGSHAAHLAMLAFAYLATIVFTVLAAQAVVGYFREATAGLGRPILAAIVFCVTSVRIVGAAAIIVAAVSHHWLLVVVLALISFASDFLDGWLARSWHVVSSFGMTFDPLADKVVCLTLLAIDAVYVQPWYWLLFAVFAVYDVFTMTVRLVLPRPMPASKTAKLKTALLMVGLVVVILGMHVTVLAWAAGLLLIVAAVLTLRSFRGYVRAIGQSLSWLEHSPGVASIDFAAWHRQYGVRAVLFDIEGTLTPWADPQVEERVAIAIKQARKAGITHIGLVSNMHPRHGARAEAVAAQVGADAWFVPRARGERKPSPAMIHTALSGFGVSASDAAFVGDKLVDVLAARRARVTRAAWVDRLGTADHPFDRLVYRPLERLLKRALGSS